MPNFKTFNISFTDLLHAKSVNDAYDVSNELACTSTTLWLNDRSFTAFCVYSTTDCNINFDCDTSPKCDGVSVSLYHLAEVEAFIGNAGWYAFNRKGIIPTGNRKSVGDVLVKCNSFDLIGGNNTTFIVEVSTSSTALAGDYNIDINARHGSISSTLRLTSTVLPATLPCPQDYKFNAEYWQHPFNISDYYGVEPFGEEHLSLLTDHMQFYKSIGGSGITVSIVDEAWGGQTYGKGEIRYPSLIKWIKGSDGNFKFDYTWFDKWCQLNRTVGNDDKIICYSMMPWGSKIRYFDEKKSKYITKSFPPSFTRSYRKIWSIFLTDFINHLDKNGIFDKVYIGFDERVHMQKVLDFVTTFTNKEGNKFKIAASFNNINGNKKIFDMLDSASMGVDEIRQNADSFRSLCHERAAQGRQTTMYTAVDHFPNSFTLSQPSEGYWSIMYAYSMGSNGFLRWAFDAWVKDPLRDTTHCSFPAGDCFLVYPSEVDADNKTPQWSLRLVKLDEGIRDVNKLIIMSNSRPDLADKIAKLLKTIKANYSYNSLKNPSWGVAIREAKWADDNSRQELAHDMAAVKAEITRLCKEYSNN